MEHSQLSNTISLYYELEDRGSVALYSTATHESVELIQATWGLPSPMICNVYIMRSWVKTLFHSSPWILKIIYAIYLPLYFKNFLNMWKWAGGWCHQFKNQPAVCLKAPDLFVATDTDIGNKLMIRGLSIEEKIRLSMAHELTHAYSIHLKLPMWINEGIAIISSETLIKKPIILESSLDFMNDFADKKSLEYGGLAKASNDFIAYQYTRGYWVTKFLYETSPEFIHSLFVKKLPHSKIDKMLAEHLDLRVKDVWVEAEKLAYEYFSNKRSIKPTSGYAG